MISLRFLLWWLLMGCAGTMFLAYFLLWTTLWKPASSSPSSDAVSNGASSSSSSRQLHDNNGKIVARPMAYPYDKEITHQILEFLNASHQKQSSSKTATTMKQQQEQQLAPHLQHLKETWEWPLVHIVNTRFMQEQGHLKALGMARLHLFRTFCLPTMVHQSTQAFLWIIKTDPDLNPFILGALIHDLEAYPNIYLVGSNVNFMVRGNHEPSMPHSWRDGAEIRDVLEPASANNRDATTKIYTGNLTRLYQAMLVKDHQIVLETRLDADDGLHQNYLRHIQEKALARFLPLESDAHNNPSHQTPTATIPKWLYWCARRHVEWHGGIQAARTSSQAIAATTTTTVDYYGSLQVIEHSKLCITPGITVGFGIDTRSDEVPTHAHDKLYEAIHDMDPEQACGYDKSSRCLELVEDFLVVAVRARTPTSAGMQRIEGITDDDDTTNGDDGGNNATSSTNNANQTSTKKKKKKNKTPQIGPTKFYIFWDLLHDDFAVRRERIKYTNRYILNHLVPIAKDNLIGQCTSDHSCKVS